MLLAQISHHAIDIVEWEEERYTFVCQENQNKVKYKENKSHVEGQ